jgi:hypothetical protein
MRCRRIFSRDFARHGAALAALLSSCALTLADPAAKPDASGLDTNGAPLSAEAEAALRDALVFDPARWMEMKPATPRAPSQKASGHDLDWNRTDKQDGSSAVTVKKPLPIEWDAKVGADFGFAPTPGVSYQPDRPLPYSKDQNTGADGLRATWASVTVPGVASIDARVDPAKDQSKLGTTISRSVPVGSAYSVTLQNSFAVTETLGGVQNTPAATGTAPPGTPPAQVWSNDRLVKFNFLSTGTSFAAGTTTSTIDRQTRNKISAEQKLFEGLNITTTVTDVGAPSIAKSITAGFKWKW